MRDIDFISEVVKELSAHWPRIEHRFTEENERFKALIAQDHNLIGHVLKCHLILENYINRHLEAVSPKHNWSSANLRFGQKIDLLPEENPKVRWILPGIRELNVVRNRLGHRLDAAVDLSDFKECLEALKVARSGKTYSRPIEVVEDFTTVACTWLIVDDEIEKIFNEAFKRARARC